MLDPKATVPRELLDVLVLGTGVAGRSAAFSAPHVAVGIPAAAHHVGGIGASARIDAIDGDEQAPVFGITGVGVVAGCREFTPALIDALGKRRLGAARTADRVH